MGFWYLYNSNLLLGQYIQIYELIVVILYLTWCVGLLFVGIWQADEYNTKLMEVMQASAMTPLLGFKYTILAIMEAAGIYVGGIAVKSSAYTLLYYFDNYNKSVNTQLQWADTEQTIQLAFDLFLAVFESFMVLTLISGVIVQSTWSLKQYITGDSEAALEGS